MCPSVSCAAESMGLGLYPGRAMLLNHSCRRVLCLPWVLSHCCLVALPSRATPTSCPLRPNCELIFGRHGQQDLGLTLCASESIKEGDQLCCGYLRMTVEPSAVRQVQLSQSSSPQLCGRSQHCTTKTSRHPAPPSSIQCHPAPLSATQQHPAHHAWQHYATAQQASRPPAWAEP